MATDFGGADTTLIYEFLRFVIGENMSVSRESFNISKGYVEVQFNQDVPLLDSELNEAQKILRAALEDTRRAGLGTSVSGDEWRVVSSPDTNSIVIKKGTFSIEVMQFVCCKTLPLAF